MKRIQSNAASHLGTKHGFILSDCTRLGTELAPRLGNESLEQTSLLHELMRCAKFLELTRLEYSHLVGVYDCRYSMGNREDGRRGKIGSDRRLDYLVALDVDIGCGFVHHHQARLLQ